MFFIIYLICMCVGACGLALNEFKTKNCNNQPQQLTITITITMHNRTESTTPIVMAATVRTTLAHTCVCDCVCRTCNVT